MKVGLFLTNQQFLDTDMIAALDDQIAMVHHARILAGIRCYQDNTI